MPINENAVQDDQQRLGPNAAFIGTSARQALNTPCLVLDLDVLGQNIGAMAAYARKADIKLRPHAKSHKSASLAKLQIAAGATGVCCATIGEAEVLGRAGIDNILITSPVATKAKLARFQALSSKVRCLAVVVDNPSNVSELAELAESQGQTFDVVVDIDPGMQRTGVRLANACGFVSRVASTAGLRYCGIQFYAGHLQHINEYAARKKEALSALDGLKQVVAELAAQGLAPDVITGSGTGTFDIDVDFEIFTELQVGSYVFMDSEYRRVSHEGERPSFGQSLFVQAAVCSMNFEGFATVDAGLKHFSLDAGLPELVRSRSEGAQYTFLGDEHGRVTLPSTDIPLSLGERVEFVPPHCDPTINLYNHYHCFRGDRLTEIWPIDARGK